MRRAIGTLFIVAFLSISVGLMLWKPQNSDCDKIEKTCDRKSGCKCQRECDEYGRLLPAKGGRQECPSYCCEGKCKCHRGCP